MSVAAERVVVLRSAEDAGALADALRAEGLEPVMLPLLDSRETLGDDALRATLALAEECWVAVTSPRAARRLARLAPLFPWVRVASVGPATSAPLAAAGVHVDLEGEGGGAAGLVAAFSRPGVVDGEARNVVWICSDRARPTLGRGLEAAGFKVIAVAAYETVLLRPPPEAVARALDGAAAVCFTSPSSVEALEAALEVPGASGPRGRFVAAALGESTAAALKCAGFARIVVAQETTVSSLARAVGAALEAST